MMGGPPRPAAAGDERGTHAGWALAGTHHRSSGTAMDLETYAIRHPQLRPAFRMPPDVVPSLGRLGRDDLVLDVGCGEGGTIIALKEKFPVPRFVGVDASVHRSYRARRAGATVLVSDGTRIGVAGDSVAIVLSRHVIEHVGDDEAMLRELHRVLRPGGLLYLETPLRLRGAWYPYRNHLGRHVLDPTHLREYSSSETVLGLLTRTGFVDPSMAVRKLLFPIDEMTRKFLDRIGVDPETAKGLVKAVPGRLPILRYRELCCMAVKSPSPVEGPE